MSQNNKLIFVTHNKGKVESANKYFEGNLEFQTYDYDFREIRSESIEEIAIAKVLEAYEMTKQPTIALDAGFYVEKLNGFPGVYVKHFLDTIGIAGLLKLLLGEDERECCFKQCLAYYDGKGWMIPISSQADKYKGIIEKKKKRYGKCNTIVIGLFAGKENAFLIQNAFPVIQKYFDHIHTIQKQPVTIHKKLDKVLVENLNEVLAMHNRGIKLTFTDITAIRVIMEKELEK